MLYAYILNSSVNHRLYIGKTANLKVRFKEHKAGQNASAKPYRSWKIISYEAYIKKTSVNSREKYLKITQGHRAMYRTLRDYLAEFKEMHFKYQGFNI